MKTMELRSGRCQIDSVETRLHYLHAFYKHPRAEMDKTNQTKAFFFISHWQKKEGILRAIKWFPTMQHTVWMHVVRPALHNQKERVFFFLSFWSTLPLSHLSGCLLNNYSTLPSQRVSQCHSETRRRRGCAVVSIVRLFQSGAFQWFSLHLPLFKQVQLARRQNRRSRSPIVPVSALVLHTYHAELKMWKKNLQLFHLAKRTHH